MSRTNAPSRPSALVQARQEYLQLTEILRFRELDEDEQFLRAVAEKDILLKSLEAMCLRDLPLAAMESIVSLRAAEARTELSRLAFMALDYLVLAYEPAGQNEPRLIPEEWFLLANRYLVAQQDSLNETSVKDFLASELLKSRSGNSEQNGEQQDR